MFDTFEVQSYQDHLKAYLQRVNKGETNAHREQEYLSAISILERLTAVKMKLQRDEPDQLKKQRIERMFCMMVAGMIKSEQEYDGKYADGLEAEIPITVENSFIHDAYIKENKTLQAVFEKISVLDFCVTNQVGFKSTLEPMLPVKYKTFNIDGETVTIHEDLLAPGSDPLKVEVKNKSVLICSDKKSMADDAVEQLQQDMEKSIYTSSGPYSLHTLLSIAIIKQNEASIQKIMACKNVAANITLCSDKYSFPLWIALQLDKVELVEQMLSILKESPVLTEQAMTRINSVGDVLLSYCMTHPGRTQLCEDVKQLLDRCVNDYYCSSDLVLEQPNSYAQVRELAPHETSALRFFVAGVRQSLHLRDGDPKENVYAEHIELLKSSNLYRFIRTAVACLRYEPTTRTRTIYQSGISITPPYQEKYTIDVPCNFFKLLQQPLQSAVVQGRLDIVKAAFEAIGGAHMLTAYQQQKLIHEAIEYFPKYDKKPYPKENSTPRLQVLDFLLTEFKDLQCWWGISEHVKSVRWDEITSHYIMEHFNTDYAFMPILKALRKTHDVFSLLLKHAVEQSHCNLSLTEMGVRNFKRYIVLLVKALVDQQHELNFKPSVTISIENHMLALCEAIFDLQLPDKLKAELIVIPYICTCFNGNKEIGFNSLSAKAEEYLQRTFTIEYDKSVLERIKPIIRQLSIGGIKKWYATTIDEAAIEAAAEQGQSKKCPDSATSSDVTDRCAVLHITARPMGSPLHKQLTQGVQPHQQDDSQESITTIQKGFGAG